MKRERESSSESSGEGGIRGRTASGLGPAEPMLGRVVKSEPEPSGGPVIWVSSGEEDEMEESSLVAERVKSDAMEDDHLETPLAAKEESRCVFVPTDEQERLEPKTKEQEVAGQNILLVLKTVEEGGSCRS